MNFENDIQLSLAALQEGKTMLYPTDTIWGIGCDATNESAVAKIYKLKKRADEKSMIILLADEEEITSYVQHPSAEIIDYLKQVTKPTTVIYDGAKNLASNLINQDGSIAIRIVNDPFCRALIRLFNKPIVSTSANISGHPSPKIFNDIEPQIKSGVDYIVQHRQHETNPSNPSAIIRWNADGTIHIIRP
ncbi:MAG: threonylcarbamoyl-AMP synthase [Bacteroidetes bacterium]|nr:threonylcarbamoyl-AMP synthase [Bacteroidota bacterium]